MRMNSLLIAASVIMATAGLPAGQDAPARDAPKSPEPLFVRLSVYPTASLSRYDYNNDIDLYEVRVYVELRSGSQEGRAIADARVSAFSETLDYREDHYEKRIILERGRLPAEVNTEIAVTGRPAVRETFPLPAWLVLAEPRPAVVDPGRDLAVRWSFTRFPSAVDVLAYDFRTGQEFFRKDHLEETSVVIPSTSLPASTIVRIYIIQSWLYKRFLGGQGYARGSEVNVIPWSQVFVRTGGLPGKQEHENR